MTASMIPVEVRAADGPTIVLHTVEEFERLWFGVDREAAWAMDGFNEPQRSESV